MDPPFELTSAPGSEREPSFGAFVFAWFSASATERFPISRDGAMVELQTNRPHAKQSVYWENEIGQSPAAVDKKNSKQRNTQLYRRLEMI